MMDNSLKVIAADRKIAESNYALAKLWENVANWHLYHAKANWHYFVLKGKRVKELEELVRGCGELPSSYVAMAGMYDKYYG